MTNNPTIDGVSRFWCHEAQNIRCVRESDYDALQSTIAQLEDKLNKAIDLDFQRRETIAGLEARVQELESGRGEPVADDLEAFERHWYAQKTTAMGSAEAQKHFDAGLAHGRGAIKGEPIAYWYQHALNQEPGLCFGPTGTVPGGIVKPLYAVPPVQVAVVPEGWKMVPVEPTELMNRAGDESYSWNVAKIYKAMIDSVPAMPCLDSTAALNEGRE